MMNNLTAQMVELAEVLQDLRQRFHQAARLEVAQAIGAALRELARATICGPARYPSPGRSGQSAWEDDWHEPAEDGWPEPAEHGWVSQDAYAQDARSDEDGASRRVTILSPLLAGIGAARWGFGRTRQILPALLIGLAVAVAAWAGGPTVKTLLKAWTTATELLSFPGSDRRL
jgi:hypothetical protein